METLSPSIPIFSLLLFVFVYLITLRSKNKINKLEQKMEKLEYTLQLLTNKTNGSNLSLGKENREFLDNIMMPNPTTQENDEIVELIMQRKKINAIKKARELYDFNLKDAKDYVERLEKKYLH